jgi:hypothetical protein
MIDVPDKASLIRHALGSGLQGLLPGQHHQAAIPSRTALSWHGSNGCGEVTKAGIAWYPDTEALRANQPGLAIPWRDVIALIERGCVDSNRERYEAAWRAHVEHSGTPLPEPWVPAYLLEARGLSPNWFFESEANQAHWARTTEVGRELSAAAEGIVTAGCAREPVQELLW